MIRIYAAIAILIASVIGSLYFGYTSGEAHVQAQWDAKKASQLVVAVTASEAARSTEYKQAGDFTAIATDYLQATTHAYPTLGATLPAAVSAGTFQLRDVCPKADRPASSASMPEATARSRIADAAATQALADRVKNSIAAVRAGDEADARERQYRALIISLRGILNAERKPP